MAKRIVYECDICKRECDGDFYKHISIFKRKIFKRSTNDTYNLGTFCICDDCIEEIARKVKGARQ